MEVEPLDKVEELIELDVLLSQQMESDISDEAWWVRCRWMIRLMADDLTPDEVDRAIGLLEDGEDGD